jgi:hypothetical protein
MYSFLQVEALRKNERQDETQFTTKTDGFRSWRSGKMKDRMKLSLPPKLMVFGVSSPP